MSKATELLLCEGGFALNSTILLQLLMNWGSFENESVGKLSVVEIKKGSSEMEHNELLKRQCTMLGCLSGLPRRMLGLHGAENVTEFVLHDLCQQDCFNLTKAAYFVDNPDFNCTKGVAGFSREERGDACNIWEKPHEFSADMKNSQFNQMVRGVASCSLNLTKGGDLHEELAKKIAKDLNFTNYAYCTWNMKHDNHGFVLYEKADKEDPFVEEHLLNGLSLLSFCPIF